MENRGGLANLKIVRTLMILDRQCEKPKIFFVGELIFGLG